MELGVGYVIEFLKADRVGQSFADLELIRLVLLNGKSKCGSR